MIKSPLYILDKHVYPAIRRQLVISLYTKGFKVSEISRLTGYSKSLITRYLKGERGSLIDISKYSDIREMIEEVVWQLITGELDTYKLETRLIKIALYMMKKRYLCMYHKMIDPEIDPSKCRICSEAF